jgi:hypothetical protein
MSRVGANRPRTFAKSPKPIGGAYHIARLFVPAYEAAISINVSTLPQTRNSDARRRLARMFESRRVVS